MIRSLALFALLLGSCSTALEGARPPDSKVKPPGEGWFCTSESSGMLSVCERTAKLCRRARRYLAKRQTPRGSMVVFSRCEESDTAYCYTALRREVRESSEKLKGDEDEGAEEMEVVKEKVWLCHATRANCESNRDNMYLDGFTDVSRCRAWH